MTAIGRDEKHLGREKGIQELEHVGQSNTGQSLAATLLEILKAGQQPGKKKARYLYRKSQNTAPPKLSESSCDCHLMLYCQ